MYLLGYAVYNLSIYLSIYLSVLPARKCDNTSVSICMQEEEN